MAKFKAVAYPHWSSGLFVKRTVSSRRWLIRNCNLRYWRRFKNMSVLLSVQITALAQMYDNLLKSSTTNYPKTHEPIDQSRHYKIHTNDGYNTCRPILNCITLRNNIAYLFYNLYSIIYL